MKEEISSNEAVPPDDYPELAIEERDDRGNIIRHMTGSKRVDLLMEARQLDIGMMVESGGFTYDEAYKFILDQEVANLRKNKGQSNADSDS